MKVLRILLIAIFFIAACSDDKVDGGSDAETSAETDKQLREYNLKVREEQAKKRTSCDTLSLQDYIINNYEAGDYLVMFDKTLTYTIPKPAVYYYKDKNTQYIFAVIAKSKRTERYVEPQNLVGYESSFINLDSTKLGTAFFYLTLFECDGNGDFTKIWESSVPNHGGFNRMTLKRWPAKNTMYMELNFEAGIISGHRNYNYFFIDGIRNGPHLMETYLGIVHKRHLANVNNDKFPDYFEYRFIDSSDYIRIYDSIPFYWSEKRNLYITDKNRRWTRPY